METQERREAPGGTMIKRSGGQQAGQMQNGRALLYLKAVENAWVGVLPASVVCKLLACAPCYGGMYLKCGAWYVHDLLQPHKSLMAWHAKVCEQLK